MDGKGKQEYEPMGWDISYMPCIIHRGVNNGQAKLSQQNEYLALYVRGRKQTMACQWVPSHPWYIAHLPWNFLIIMLLCLVQFQYNIYA